MSNATSIMTNGASQNSSGDITGISMDVPVAGISAVTLTARKRVTVGVGTVICQGTLPGAGHLDYAFDQDIFLKAGFNLVVTDAGGATVQYEVYGAGFGVPFAPRAGSNRARG